MLLDPARSQAKSFIWNTFSRAESVEMKAFEVKGQMMTARRNWQPFALEVAASDEKAAVEKTMALMGSRHKLKRKFLQIDGVKTLGTDEITDQAVKHLLGVKK